MERNGAKETRGGYSCNKNTPMYKIVLDLRAFPFSEEMMHECEDGKTRAGIFIPYEENNVYRGERMAVTNIVALVNSPARRRTTPNNIDWTHTLQPYWTRPHREWMAEQGIEKTRVFLGHMEVMLWTNWGNYSKKERKAGQ